MATSPETLAGTGAPVGHRVFLSYASHDRSVADRVCLHLENRGLRCWMAPRDILPGHSYAEAIVDAIDSCRVMVLIFSSHSDASPHVQREVERAVTRRKALVPFWIEDVPAGKAMEYFLSTPHRLHAHTGDLETHLESLSTAVRHLVDGQEVGGQAGSGTRRRPGQALVAGFIALAMTVFWVRSHRMERLPLVAPPVAVPSARPGGGLSVALEVAGFPARTLLDHFGPDTRPQVRYQMDSGPGGLRTIRPTCAYLDQVRAGTPVAPLPHSDGSGSPLAVELPVLDIKLVNNGPRSVMLTSLVLDVLRSGDDRSPLVIPVVDPRRPGWLGFLNEGWSPVAPGTVDLDAGPPGTPPGGPPRFHRVLSSFETEQGLDLKRELQEAQVPVLEVSPVVPVPSVSAAPPLSSRPRRPRSNEASMASVWGVARFSSGPSAAATSATKVRFEAEVHRSKSRSSAPPWTPPSKPDVWIGGETSRHQRTVPLSQILAPGETDRIAVRVGSPRSSRHRIDLTLVGTDGGPVRLALPTLDLEIFWPRHAAARLSPPAQGAP